MSATESADTKDALARDLPEAEHCRAALRDALLYYGSAQGVFRTQRASVARLARSLLGGGSAAIRKVPSTQLRRVPRYEIALGEAPAPRLPSARCDRRMELRAAFLACGSLAEPSRGYHLEFVPLDERAAARLTKVLRADGHRPKSGSRKGRPLLYFKASGAIADVLSAIGAFAAVLHLEDVRALKETKNRIHRLVNTEAANVERAAGAAAAQRATIAFLADAHGLARLSPALREIAELRLLHPSESLAELGRRCNPPAKKSAVGARIGALLRVARSLEARQGSAANTR